MAVQLMSNVKIITSGTAPTTENLLPGQAAFGKLNSDNKYHLFGNIGEGGGAGKVVDIVLDTYSSLAAITLDQVLQAGNSTTLDIEFKETSEGPAVTIIGKDGLTIGTTTVTSAGFKDNGYAVLSANPSNTIDTTAAQQMRTFLDTYSKAEVDAFVAGVFVFKGSVAYENLPTEDVKVGWTYNILSVPASGATDVHGQAIKAGDNVVYVAASETPDDEHEAGWDALAGTVTVDLSNYYPKSETYSKTETNNLLDAKANTTDVYTKTDADGKFATQETVSGINTRLTTAEGKITAIEDAGYQTADDVNQILTNGHYVADESYVHTDNNFDNAAKAKVDAIVTNGDGTKVLTDNGTYQTLELSVVAI